MPRSSVTCASKFTSWDVNFTPFVRTVILFAAPVQVTAQISMQIVKFRVFEVSSNSKMFQRISCRKKTKKKKFPQIICKKIKRSPLQSPDQRIFRFPKPQPHHANQNSKIAAVTETPKTYRYMNPPRVHSSSMKSYKWQLSTRFPFFFLFFVCVEKAQEFWQCK